MRSFDCAHFVRFTQDDTLLERYLVVEFVAEAAGVAAG